MIRNAKVSRSYYKTLHLPILQALKKTLGKHSEVIYMKYDWKAVESYFLEAGHQSRISLREVSERYDIPYQSVRRYAAKREWHNIRHRAWIDERYKTS